MVVEREGLKVPTLTGASSLWDELSSMMVATRSECSLHARCIRASRSPLNALLSPSRKVWTPRLSDLPEAPTLGTNTEHVSLKRRTCCVGAPRLAPWRWQHPHCPLPPPPPPVTARTVPYTHAASPHWPPPLAHSLRVPGTRPQIPGNKTLCLHKLISLVKSPGSWWASPWPPMDLMKMKGNGQSPPKVLKREEMLPLCTGSEDVQHEHGLSSLALGSLNHPASRKDKGLSPAQCMLSVFIWKDGALCF